MIVGKDGKELIKVFNVVTSFDESGYQRYGKEFVRTFLEFWPKNVRLTVYYEGESEAFDLCDGVSWIPIEDVEFYQDFIENIRFPIMTGTVGDRYDINFDYRMCRKVLIEMHSLKKYKGKVFWIDGDVITHSKVPDGFLDEVLPDDKFNCHLSRDGWYYTESGFIGFNADHELAKWFYKNYLHAVMSGVIFTQPGWHDCYAFDAVRQLSQKPEAFVNLSQGLPVGTMHPFVNSVLGKFMDHRKGARKGGKSTAADLVIERDEAYWNV